MERSVKATPAAWTLTCTWPGGGSVSSVSTSFSTSGPPWLVMTTCWYFILFCLASNDLKAAHIWPEHLRHDHAAVGLLVIFDDGDNRAGQRQPRTVQRVD